MSLICRRPLHPLAEDQNVKLRLHTETQQHAPKRPGLGSHVNSWQRFPKACERRSLRGTSLLPRARVLGNAQLICPHQRSEPCSLKRLILPTASPGRQSPLRDRFPSKPSHRVKGAIAEILQKSWQKTIVGLM